jgi:hypothetical protein
MRQLLVVQSEASALLEETHQLKARIRELETTQSTAAQLRFDPPFYLLADQPHPYCARCWDECHQLIHLLQIYNTRWNCPSCKNTFSKFEGGDGGISVIPLSRPRRGF